MHRLARADYSANERANRIQLRRIHGRHRPTQGSLAYARAHPEHPPRRLLDDYKDAMRIPGIEGR